MAYSGAMRPPRPTLRAGALLAATALALHELRYVLVPAGHEGAGGRHAYIPLMATAATVLLALAAVQLTAAAGRARRGADADLSNRPLLRTWALASAALLALYLTQELVEAAVTSGELAGASVVGVEAGLVTLGLAAVLGGVVVLALRGADAAVAAAARRRPRRRGWALMAGRPRSAPARAWPSVFGRHAAGRAPPLLS